MGYTAEVKRSNVKVTAGIDPKNLRISQPNEGNFTQFWSQMDVDS